MTPPERTPAPEDGAALYEESLPGHNQGAHNNDRPRDCRRCMIERHVRGLTAALTASRAEVATERRLNEQHQAALDQAELERDEARAVLETTLTHLKRYHKDALCPVIQDAESVLATGKRLEYPE